MARGRGPAAPVRAPGQGRGSPEGPRSQPRHGGRGRTRTVPMATRLPLPAPPRPPALTHGAHRPAQRRAGPDSGQSEPAAPGRAQGRGQRSGAASSGAARYNRPHPAPTPLAVLRPAPRSGSSHWPGTAGALGCCSPRPMWAGALPACLARTELVPAAALTGAQVRERWGWDGTAAGSGSSGGTHLWGRSRALPVLVCPWLQRFLPAR